MVTYIASFQALLGVGFALVLFLLRSFTFFQNKSFPSTPLPPFSLLFFQPPDFIGEGDSHQDPSLIPQLSLFKVSLSLTHIWMVREMKLVYFRPKLVDICSLPFQTSQECSRSWYLGDEILFVFLKTERDIKLAHFNPKQWTRCKTFSSLAIPFKNMLRLKRISCLRSEAWEYRIYFLLTDQAYGN